MRTTTKWIDNNIFFTKEELKVIGNFCETTKHWKRHNSEARFADRYIRTTRKYSGQMYKRLYRYMEKVSK